MEEILNAQITDTSLTMGEHGCLTSFIYLSCPEFEISYGGYCFGHGYLGAKSDFFDASDKGLVALMRIMDVVGVETYEDLKDKYVRVKLDEDNRVYAIGNLMKDKWFSYKEFYNE